MSTHVFFLLDMTGSMLWNKEATIDACNEFISAQQSNSGADDSVFTLGVFNSNIGLERIVREVSLDRAPRIDHEHYRPDGATPLYDAVGEAMTLLESHTGPVLFIIQTDGEENSSRRVTRDEVLTRVAEKTADGWQFVYLGCDIDAMQQGGKLGIPVGNTMSYRRSDTEDAFHSLTASTQAYLAQGSAPSGSFFKEGPAALHDRSNENDSGTDNPQ